MPATDKRKRTTRAGVLASNELRYARRENVLRAHTVECMRLMVMQRATSRKHCNKLKQYMLRCTHSILLRYTYFSRTRAPSPPGDCTGQQGQGTWGACLCGVRHHRLFNPR